MNSIEYKCKVYVIFSLHEMFEIPWILPHSLKITWQIERNDYYYCQIYHFIIRSLLFFILHLTKSYTCSYLSWNRVQTILLPLSIPTGKIFCEVFFFTSFIWYWIICSSLVYKYSQICSPGLKLKDVYLSCFCWSSSQNDFIAGKLGLWYLCHQYHTFPF